MNRGNKRNGYVGERGIEEKMRFGHYDKEQYEILMTKKGNSCFPGYFREFRFYQPGTG
jgi:hypothetical protein